MRGHICLDFVFGISLLASACGREQIPDVPHQIASQAQTTPGHASQTPPSRPILYMDLEKGKEREGPVTAAVYPSGQYLGTVVKAPSATWSPDGSTFAYVTEDSALKLKELRGETFTILGAAAGERFYPWPVWSPDGRSIALIVTEESSPSSLVVIDVVEKKIRSRHALSKDTIHLPNYFSGPDKLRWSPDGHKILISWENAVVIDTGTGTIQTISPTQVAAEWAPGSDAIYVFEIPRPSRYLGSFYLRKLGSKTPVKLAGEERVKAFGLTPGFLISARMLLSPLGSRLAIVAGSRGKHSVLHVYDLTGGKTVVLDKPSKTFQSDDWIVALDWDPDGNSLAVVAIKEEEVRVKVLNLTTEEWKTLATVSFPLSVPEIDTLGLLKALSWTQ